jgi:hypothetical protein
MAEKAKREDLYDTVVEFMRDNNINDREDLILWIAYCGAFPLVNDLCEIVGYPKESE